MSADEPSCPVPTSPEEVVKHFDQAAATWDDNPHRRELTRGVAAAICTRVPLQARWRMLEYGCGTGALSLLLASRVAEVVSADASAGMVEQLRRKLADVPGAHVRPLQLDLTRDRQPDESFELIVTAMTLHHVTDVPGLLKKLSGILRPGGWLAIADLQAEDGSFHTDLKVPHNGFEPQKMAQDIAGAIGATFCPFYVVHEVIKPNGRYPVCLWTACKPAATD